MCYNYWTRYVVEKITRHKKNRKGYHHQQSSHHPAVVWQVQNIHFLQQCHTRSFLPLSRIYSWCPFLWPAWVSQMQTICPSCLASACVICPEQVSNHHLFFGKTKQYINVNCFNTAPQTVSTKLSMKFNNLRTSC